MPIPTPVATGLFDIQWYIAPFGSPFLGWPRPRPLSSYLTVQRWGRDLLFPVTFTIVMGLR